MWILMSWCSLHTCRYGMAVDWWALGALTYELITGRALFLGANIKAIIEKILFHEILFSSSLSPQVASLCMHVFHQKNRWVVPSKAAFYIEIHQYVMRFLVRGSLPCMHHWKETYSSFFTKICLSHTRFPCSASCSWRECSSAIPSLALGSTTQSIMRSSRSSTGR